MIVNQWVAAAHRGDAVGDSARRVQALLRGMGHQSDLYAIRVDDDLAAAFSVEIRADLKRHYRGGNSGRFVQALRAAHVMATRG